MEKIASARTSREKRLGHQFLHIGMALLFSALPALASHPLFERGDIIAGGRRFSGLGFSDGRIDWFHADGTLNRRIANGFDEFPHDFAFDRSGRLYAGGIGIFDRAGNPDGSFSVANRTLTFDASGNVYFGIGNRLIKVGPNGEVIREFFVAFEAVGGGVASVDLAADQCTIFYTSQGKRAFRYDVCNAVQLPDLNSALPGFSANTLRILPDGQILITDSEAIYLLSSAGAITRAYDVPGPSGWDGLALDIDGRSFWAASGDRAMKFDLATGAVVASFTTSDYAIWAMAVVGEPRAATAAQAAAPIPTLSEWMLITLALLLGGVGALSLKTHLV